MKRIFILFIMLIAAASAGAQTSGTQVITLNLTNTITIKFSNTQSETGSAVNIPFATINDYVNGVTSASQELSVSSNKNFNVTVKANASNFTYTGSASPAPVMPVTGSLFLNVSANSTGGAIASPFSSGSYGTLTGSVQNLITNGSRGAAQTFSVRYQAMPGFSYAAGTYTVDIIYTATQL